MSDDLKERGHEGMLHILMEHPFLADLAEEHSNLICGCARNVRFAAGDYLLREGDPADEFYLIREGRVALEINVPGHPGLTFQTLDPGALVGVSWLISPYKWTYDGRALEEVRAISLDAKCLRNKCNTDHDLGYEMMNRFVPILVQRLQATRLQLLDVYGQND